MTPTNALRGAVATLALAAPLFLVATPADAAAPYFSSCDRLTRAWPNGVAKGRVAANMAVRDGYSRPATTPRAVAVYWENYRRLDRDRDGTACEN
ncbi:calcium-binding protein [Nocardioides sp. MAH-18]|uniref:Calcium-binding protein n=1 Tax=Nocardioides agri TaxID=2682843 RepID=A0A6L6XMK3_9ACTN|nr:excalibur calcium-binding domain-containing protein [Nocardioides sp. CGMCC 1.13656]MVQ48310.1 calcium-binding protein [Nocardioides sp. MAH-18]